MSRRTLVYFVCSPHPRTGVTTAARLLSDYYIYCDEWVEGFDLDPRDRRYANCFPVTTHIVDISEVRGQIGLFDRLLVADGVPKVVDVSRSYEQLFSTIAEIGFFEEAQRVGVQPIVLYQADATESAAASALMLATTWPDLWISVLHNEGAAPLGEDAFEILSLYPARGKFVIPALDQAIARHLEDPRLSLSHFLLDPPLDMSIVVRAALKSWLAPIFTQFHTFQLRLDLQSSELFR